MSRTDKGLLKNSYTFSSQTPQQLESCHLLSGGGKGYLPIKASLRGQQEKVPIDIKCSGSRLCGQILAHGQLDRRNLPHIRWLLGDLNYLIKNRILLVSTSSAQK